MLLTRRFRFAASHRLHTSALSEQENRRLYGKCNNPHGHGHDYILDVTVEGTPDATGQIVDRTKLEKLVQNRVVDQLDHKNLNLDCAAFRDDVPTTENLASLIHRLLDSSWNLPAKLKTIRISETDRNAFTLDL